MPVVSILMLMFANQKPIQGCLGKLGDDDDRFGLQMSHC